MKLTIFGGGSTYTPELIDGLIHHHDSIPVSEVCLLDISESRLALLGPLAERMLARAGLPVTVTTTTDRRRGLDGADFVNGLIRVGGMDARINDERIPLRHGVVGQETTGPGGMMKALRTIPVMLDLARDMEQVCPDAWLINYTNPSGIVAEALGNHSRVKFVGLCSGPMEWMAQVLDLMGVEPHRANVEWMGLNHLGFVTRVWVDGQDATERAIEAVADHWKLDGDLIRVLGAIPASYLGHYYHRDRRVAQASAAEGLTRGEEVKAIEAGLLRLYADPDLAERPELLRRRGGRGYSQVAFAAMLAIHNNTGDRQVLQVLNQGALDGIPDDASVEVPCVVDASGTHPLRLGPIPLPIRGLIQGVKAYESLTVRAAVEGDRRMAMQALMAHPLVPSWDVAKPLLEDLLAANRRWLPWA